MRFELFIASRYLRAKRRQAFIGIITGISIAGVAAGVASLIVALAITNGFRQDLQQRLLGASAHVQLMRTLGDGMPEWRSLLAKMEETAELPSATGLGSAGVSPATPSPQKKAGEDAGAPRAKRSADASAQAKTPDEPASTQPLLPPIVLGKELADDINATV